MEPVTIALIFGLVSELIPFVKRLPFVKKTKHEKIIDEAGGILHGIFKIFSLWKK